MKVVCINNESIFSISSNVKMDEITVGNIYDVISESTKYYKVICNLGGAYEFPKSRFISLSKHRVTKLKELGI